MLAALLLADGRFPAGSHAHSAGVEAACADGRITDEPSLASFLDGRLRATGLVDAALATATHLALTPHTATTAAGGRRMVGVAANDGRHPADTPDAEGRARVADDAALRRTVIALDVAAETRIVVPSLRAASRQLGRQLVRVARRCWPNDVLAALADALPGGAHQPVALGAVGVAAGCKAVDVARLAVHHVLTTPAQAAVRLLGLDPFAVAALTAELAPLANQVAADAVAAAHAAVADADVLGPVALVAPRIRPAGLLCGLATLPAFSSPLVEIAASEHAEWEVRMFAT